jgi:rhamnose transport system ATP-binding protein
VINGLIVAYGGVPAIVVTLGTLAIYRGIDSVVASGVQFSTTDVPPAWIQWAIHDTFGVSARCQAVWSRSACFSASGSLGRLMPTMSAGAGVEGWRRNRSGCSS